MITTMQHVTWKFNYFLALDLVKWFPYAQIWKTEIENKVYHAGVLQGGQMLNRVFYVISILLSTVAVIGCASEASYEQLNYH